MSWDFIGSKVTLVPAGGTKVTSLSEVEMTPLWVVIHPQYHINAIGGQHSQIHRELVVPDDHFHIFVQQGAPDISEW
jgi:hypothetical protein